MSANVSILGNLGGAVDAHTSENGTFVAKFSIASNSVQNTPQGAAKKTDWFRVTAIGKQAETLAKYARKGTRLHVQGYLDFEGKSDEEMDANFMSFERLEQYDENGIVGFSMSGDQHTVVVYDFSAEVSADYLPQDARSLAREMNLIFVGHALGGAAAQRARQFIFAHHVSFCLCIRFDFFCFSHFSLSKSSLVFSPLVSPNG